MVVGCDRVAANGDVANKVGTYAHALAAAAAGIPFVVAGPCHHDRSDVRNRGRHRHRGARRRTRSAPRAWAERPRLLTLEGTPCRNPAFDVTPAAW